MQSVDAGFSIIGIVVLLAACAAVITILRRPKARKWVAVPAAMFVLLVGIVIAIRFAQSPRPITYAPVGIESSWSDNSRWSIEHSQAQQAAFARQLAANKASIERQRAAIASQIDANRAVIERQRAASKRQRDALARQGSSIERIRAGAPGSYTAYQVPSWAKLFLIGVAGMAVLAVGVTLFAGRKWIARHTGIVVPLVAVAGALCLLLVAGMFTYVSRVEAVAAEHRRANLAEELRVIGKSMHREAQAAEERIALRSSPPVVIIEDNLAGESAATVNDQSRSDEGPVDETAAAVDDAEAGPVPVELPGWVQDHQDNINEFGHDPILLASEQWATVEECESQLEAIAAVAVAQQLQAQKPQLSGWTPSVDFLHQSGAIQERFVEETSLQVGEEEMPMYRSYWQVAVTPQVGDLAFAQWKDSAVDQRLVWLGAGAGGLTFVFALLAGLLRIDSATNGRYRGRLALGTAGLCIALAAVATMVA